MRSRLKRGCIAATLLATLLLPATGSLADPQEKLEQTKAKLERVRERIEQGKAEAGGLRQEIDVLNREISGLQLEVNRLRNEIDQIQSEVRSAQARIDDTKRRMDRIRNRATEQAVALYKAGSTDVLDALLESKSLAELDQRAEFIGIAARRNTGALVRFGRLKLEVEDQQAELFETKEHLDGALAEQAAVLNQQERLRKELAGNLERLRSQLGEDKATEGALEKQSEKLTAQILAAQAQSAVVSLGTSASGFIWPLNGPVTSGYGVRWGRMHTGIDIDGYTGQPIVASKGGRVILASYYSGYGNAVIVDHGGGIATLYGHMSAFGVGQGQSVSQGQVVGNVGCTGSCTGDHLHFEVRLNGSPVNPMGYLP